MIYKTNSHQTKLALTDGIDYKTSPLTYFSKTESLSLLRKELSPGADRNQSHHQQTLQGRPLTDERVERSLGAYYAEG